MKSQILSKFLCCFELTTGGYLMGSIDCLLYGTIIIIFTLQNFTELKLIDKKYGEKFLWDSLSFVYILLVNYSIRVQRTLPTRVSLCFLHHISDFCDRNQTGDTKIPVLVFHPSQIFFLIPEKLEESLSISDSSRLASFRFSFHWVFYFLVCAYIPGRRQDLLFCLCIFPASSVEAW